MNENGAERQAESFTDTPVFEALARAGYLARGALYAVIGILAIRLAQGVSGPRPNQQGAMQQIEHQRFGHALLILIAIGLGGYALWRLAQALIGHTPEYGKHSALDRIGAAGSFLAYTTFCLHPLWPRPPASGPTRPSAGSPSQFSAAPVETPPLSRGRPPPVCWGGPPGAS